MKGLLGSEWGRSIGGIIISLLLTLGVLFPVIFMDILTKYLKL